MDFNFIINIWRFTLSLYVTFMKLHKDDNYHLFYRLCNNINFNVTYNKPMEDNDYDND